MIQAFTELAGVAVLLLEAERIIDAAKPALCALSSALNWGARVNSNWSQ